MRKVLAAAALAGLCACAPKPVLYPNDKFNATPREQVQADIDDCSKQARDFVKTHKADIVAGHTAVGAAMGAIFGVIAGAFTGNYTGAIEQGAAFGGAAGAVGGGTKAMSPDEVQKRYVDICLSKKGYQPIGWK